MWKMRSHKSTKYKIKKYLNTTIIYILDSQLLKPAELFKLKIILREFSLTRSTSIEDKLINDKFSAVTCFTTFRVIWNS